MYHIIGTDQKEYGPISTAQIRQWFAEGRLHRGLAARPANETEWKTLGTLPEFADMCPPPPGLTPPTPVTTENCGLATWALVCGALGMVTCITAPVGLILGFTAHSRIRGSNGRLTGSGLATTGIVLSLIAVLLWLLAIPAAMLLPALAHAKMRAQSINCVNNVKQLSLGLRLYSADNKDVLPPATNWCDRISQHVGSARPFQCTASNDSLRSHYAFNAKLGSLSDTRISDPANTVMIFETDGGWNASGGPELMLNSSRHGGLFIVGFADGSVRQVTAAQLRQLRWDP